MSDGADTKICPMCAEPIRVAAKLCPHCRHVQARWSFLNPNVIATLVGIFWLCGILGVVLFAERLFTNRDFEPHRPQFSVIESTVTQRTTSNAIYVVVSGVISNGSSYSWKDVGVEAQIFDHDGKLIDVIPAPSDYGGIVVSAHALAAFKIESRTGRQLRDYASHKAFVRWGKDVKTWP